MKKLFLDDLRTVDMVYALPDQQGFDVARSYADFVGYIQSQGLPDLISFDNDLGLDASGKVVPDGYAAANAWFTNQVLILSTFNSRCIRPTR